MVSLAQPEIRHPKRKTLRFGAWNSIFRNAPLLQPITYSGHIMTIIKHYISGSYRNRKKGMDRPARRLSARIPTEGWETDISVGGEAHTTGKIVNMSTGGAYLMLPHPFQLDSIMTMYIKSSQLSFITRAKVVHTKPNGIGVHFLDLNGLIKDSILSQATKHINR